MQAEKRGRREPKDKTLEEAVQSVQPVKVFLLSEVNRVVKKIPTEGIFHLPIKKMCELYAEKCKSELKFPTKENVYAEIFNTKFNLSFTTSKRNICNRCDLLQTSLKTGTDEQKRVELTVQLELHTPKT